MVSSRVRSGHSHALAEKIGKKKIPVKNVVKKNRKDISVKEKTKK